MKKRWIPAATLMLVMAAGLPVFAAGEMTNSSQTGATEVTAKVQDTDSGDVTYAISIPQKIDFGMLTRPETSNPDVKTKQLSVTLVEVSGLDEATQRVAVLAQDSTFGTEQFSLVGQEANNSDKNLDYTVSTTGGNITSGKPYVNGYLITAFREEDLNNPVQLTLSLDQSQLYDAPLSEWAGSYSGTIRFYSKVADIYDYIG